MRARTHIYFLCVCAFFLYAPLHTFAATNVTGDITSDTEWTIQGSPYIVNFSNNKYSQHLLLVASSTTLTIDPGAIVKFGAYNGMTVDGALHAEGTADNPIIFTSLKDDTAGGDTNGDGNATTPTDEQWMYLQFNTDSNGTFDNATVRYGGASAVNSGGSFSEFTGIENYGGTLIVDYTTLTHNGYDGLGQYGGHTTLSHSLISNQSVGISMSGGELDMSDTRMYDNATSGIRHSDGTLSITRSEIDHNGTGITATSHGSMAMDSSSIHDNSSLGIDNQSQTISIDVANDLSLIHI